MDDSLHQPPDFLPHGNPAALHIRSPVFASDPTAFGTSSMPRPRPAPISRFAPNAGTRIPMTSRLEVTRDNDTEAYSGAGNSGGKLRSSRRAKRTPYDRPALVPSPTEGAIPVVAPVSTTVASRFKVSASRLLTSSVSYLFSAFFKARPPALKANWEPPLQDVIRDKGEKLEHPQLHHEVRIPSVKEVECGKGAVKGTVKGVEQPVEKEVPGSDITQIEEILKKSTWSRNQVDRLTELLLSRVSEDGREKDAISVVKAETKRDTFEHQTPIQLARVFMEEKAVKPSGAAVPMFSPGFYPSAKVSLSPARRLMEDRRVFSPIIRPWKQSPDVVSTPKRRFGLDNDFPFTSHMRRVRQKTSDASSFEYSRASGFSGGLSSTPHAESSKTALKILETLEKLSPSPMAEPSEVSMQRPATLIDKNLEFSAEKGPSGKEKALNVPLQESPTSEGMDLEDSRSGSHPLIGNAIQPQTKETSRDDKFIAAEFPLGLDALKEQYVEKESSTRIYPSEQILEKSRAIENRFLANGNKSETEILGFAEYKASGINFKAPGSVSLERLKGFRMTADFEEQDFEAVIDEMPVLPTMISGVPPYHEPSSVAVVQQREVESVVAEKAVIVPSSVSEPPEHVPASGTVQSVFPCQANTAASLATSIMAASTVSSSRVAENGLPMPTESPVGGQVLEADAMLLDNSMEEAVPSAPLGVSSASIFSFAAVTTGTPSMNSLPSELHITSPTSLAIFGVQSAPITSTLVTSEPLVGTSSSASMLSFQFGSPGLRGTTIPPFTSVAAQPNPFTASASALAPMASVNASPGFSFAAQAQSAPTFGMSAAATAGASLPSSLFAFGAQANGQSMNLDQGSLSGEFSIGADGDKAMTGGFSVGAGAAKSGRKFIKAKRRR